MKMRPRCVWLRGWGLGTRKRVETSRRRRILGFRDQQEEEDDEDAPQVC